MTVNKCYTVKRLKEELEQYPDDMPVLMYSYNGKIWDYTGILKLEKNWFYKEDKEDENKSKMILSLVGNDYNVKQILDYFWREKEKEEDEREAKREKDRLKELTIRYDFLSDQLHERREVLEAKKRLTDNLEEDYAKALEEFKRLEKEIDKCNETIRCLRE